MSNLYLIRNLLSLKAAKSIDAQYSFRDSVFSVIATNSHLSDIILENINKDNNNITATVKLPIYGVRFNIIKQRKHIRNAKKLIEEKLKRHTVDKLFITYPMHFDSYIYYLVAQKLNIKVCFYEEGPCFYRAGHTKQYEINNFKDAVRQLYFLLCGLKRGYSFKADVWYSSLPIQEDYQPVKLIYEKIDLPPTMNFLFLSRPVSEDYPEIKVTDEVKAIMAFYNLVCDKNILFLKFHPRESIVKQDEIKDSLISNGITVEVLDGSKSSEDIIFSMQSGAIGGYDTTTLVYADNINKKVKPYSVLKKIMDKETSGFLIECYKEYKLKYKHIYMIE